MIAFGLIVANNDPTQRGTPQHIQLLKECDDVRTYTECGWFCVLGYKDGKRIVHAHWNNEDAYRDMRDPDRRFKRRLPRGSRS